MQAAIAASHHATKRDAKARGRPPLRGTRSSRGYHGKTKKITCRGAAEPQWNPALTGRSTQAEWGQFLGNQPWPACIHIHSLPKMRCHGAKMATPWRLSARAVIMVIAAHDTSSMLCFLDRLLIFVLLCLCCWRV